MRITENRIIADFLMGINNTRERLNKLNLQVSSQQKIQTMSDDPQGASALLRYESQIERIAQYSKNVDDGSGMLKATADTIHSILTTFQDVKGIVSSSTNTNDPQLRIQLADQIDHFVTLSMDLANTQFNQKYIFGGTNTTTPPFVSTTTGNPPVQSIDYVGNTSSIQYAVGEGLQQPVNLDGKNVFTSGSNTSGMTLSGSLDANAAVGSTFAMNQPVTDSLGVVHSVVLSLTKTAANTWALSTAMPAGATDATISGGTATATFNPATGQLVGLSGATPMTMTPAGAAPGPPFSVNLQTIGLTEKPGVTSTLSGTVPTNGVNFLGALDPQAATSTTLSLTQRITDGAGATHDIVFSFTKTAADTWQVAATSASGATITGGTGTATATFNPTTGALTGFAPAVALQLTGLTSGAANMTVSLGGNGLTQTAQANSVARGDSVFSAMLALRDKLRAGDTITAADDTAMSAFEQQLMEKEATAGSMSQTLDLAKTHLGTQNQQLLTLKGSVQDVDLAQLGIQLNQEQTILTAALSAGAKIISKSLLDFLV